MRSLTPKDLGALVREARLEAELTQAELGAKIGASRFWVAEFERGKPRAELGLALKAMRALRLSLTVAPADDALNSDARARSAMRDEATDPPVVDLSAILSASIEPKRGQ